MPKKDETIVGITGKPVRKGTPKQQHELEKKRRMQKHLGKNVGGAQYSSDVNPYYNPRQRTFKEFVEIVEGKKNKYEPPNAVPGTYKVDLETGNRSYTLKPADSTETGPFKRSEVLKSLKKQGGIGRKSVLAGIEQRKKELKKLRKNAKVEEGFSYGSKSFQQQLEKKRKETEKRKQQERQQRSSELYQERTRGRGIRSYSKGKPGWIKDGRFTPDEDS